VRVVRRAVAGRDLEAAETGLRAATRALDKAVTKGLIHRNNASRRIARLAHAVSQLKTGVAA
jgi:small subunit ribosomal protein S20